MPTHVIYKLICPCVKIYVGQTKHNMKLRIAEHKAAIRNRNVDYAIARHYQERNHGTGVKKVSPSPKGGNIIKKILQREAFWIFTVNTVAWSHMDLMRHWTLIPSFSLDCR